MQAGRAFQAVERRLPASLAAGVRARLVPALAALAVHVLAIAAIVATSGGPHPAGTHDAPGLTVISLPPPPQPAPSLPAVRPAKVQSVTGQAMPAPPTARAPELLLPSLPEPALSASPQKPADSSTAPPALAPGIAPAPTSPQSRQDDAASAVSAYQQELWRHIAARRPRGIRMSGTTVLRFRVGPQGGLLSAEIAGSSGNLNLDKIALRALRQASPLPPPPPSLSGDQLLFTIPVDFR